MLIFSQNPSILLKYLQVPRFSLIFLTISSLHAFYQMHESPHVSSVRAFCCAPERNRTSDTWFRKPLLYPLSYRRIFYRQEILYSINACLSITFEKRFYLILLHTFCQSQPLQKSQNHEREMLFTFCLISFQTTS